MEKHIPFRLMTLFLILSIIMGLVSECHAQSYDSLKLRILALETNQKSIQLNLTKAHNQFRTGVLITITGTLITLLGISTDESRMTDRDDSNNSPSGLVTLGGIVGSVGTIVIIDSHRFIGRAGKRKSPRR